jgi:hypothetical protein
MLTEQVRGDVLEVHHLHTLHKITYTPPRLPEWVRNPHSLALACTP